MSKLSVVIPVYNVEKYLPRCIESLLAQTYKDIEFIFVNDCSPGNAEEIIKGYKDERIRYLTYDKNRGLFRARVAGAEIATGEYITFHDSDDFCTPDYYRTLMASAEKYKSDIVVGKTIFRRANGENYVRNLHDECFNFKYMEGEKVRDTYFAQKGSCFSWHTVWNKIYSKELWDKCMPYYQKVDVHLIMTEDIAFSSPLFYFARSLSTVENDGIYYCENENASTDASKTTLKRFTKNMQDISYAFSFVENFLEDRQAPKYIKDNFGETKKYYSRMWKDLAESTFSAGEKAKALALIEEFTPSYGENTTVSDHFFESITTPLNYGLESIKDMIIKGSEKVISFDIFDTLIKRRVYRPEDVFLLLNKKFKEKTHINADFKAIRIDTEAYARASFGKTDPKREDIYIDEIYSFMPKLYGIDESVCREMMEEEIALEKRLITRRRAGGELFECAKATGKKVVLISDMYLREKTVKEILSDCGYEGYEALFLSSELGLTKNSSNLFKAALKELKISPSDMLHIGDTWRNDVENPKSMGINTAFFPKATEVYENKIQNLTTNNCSDLGLNIMGAVAEREAVSENLGYRTLCAIVCGEYFDNPYRSFSSESDFNCDPYFIGMNAIAPHIASLCEWIDKKAENKDIYFMARDGFLPKKAFDIYKKYVGSQNKSRYIYASRRMLLPFMTEQKADFFDLPVEYRNHSVATLLSLLSYCCDEDKAKESIKKGYKLSDTFSSKEEFRDFISFFTDNIYDRDIHEKSKEKVRAYYKDLKTEGITFDMGYSGRIQTALSKAVERPVDVLFIHTDTKRSGFEAKEGGYNIETYYDFKPSVSGLLREHIFSDPEPSCIGFDEKGALLFEDENKNYCDTFVVNKLQEGALWAVEEFFKIYSEYKEYMGLKKYEASLMFEGYLRAARDVDRKIFSASFFEDMVYGSNKSINIYEFVKNTVQPVSSAGTRTLSKREMIQNVIAHKGRVGKFFTLFLLDKGLLKLYIIDVLAKKPKLLRSLVKIKHALFGKPKS